MKKANCKECGKIYCILYERNGDENGNCNITKFELFKYWLNNSIRFCNTCVSKNECELRSNINNKGCFWHRFKIELLFSGKLKITAKGREYKFIKNKN